MIKILNTIKNKIKFFLMAKLAEKIRIPMVKNINLNLNKKQKRVLISYIDYFAITSFSGKIIHTNIRESVQIIDVFKELDYVIDVAYCNSEEVLKFLKIEKYDVIFGFGKVFYEMAKLNNHSKKILYVTEHHPEYSLQKETERNHYFYERTGKRIKLRRTGEFYKEEHFKNLNSLVILGEKFPFIKYNYPIFQIFPTGLINENYKISNRNFNSSKKNFLWLGSYGAVHKGLDLLTEIFSKNEEIILHICGFNKSEKYLKIPKKDNIINYGLIDVKSSLFLELTQKCSYIILPSCSEGFSTSIATGMLHSMIPVVCKDTGFNRLDCNCIFLEDYKLEYIEEKIVELSKKKNEWLEEKHKKVYGFARENFSLVKFSENIRIIVGEIINEKK